MTSTGGQLNPDWTEWLMDWPVGYTDPDRAEPVAWLDLRFDPAELAPEAEGFIPRITDRRQYRAPRIRCLGNGQVPLAAATAFDEGMARLDAWRARFGNQHTTTQGDNRT